MLTLFCGLSAQSDNSGVDESSDFAQDDRTSSTFNRKYTPATICNTKIRQSQVHAAAVQD